MERGVSNKATRLHTRRTLTYLPKPSMVRDFVMRTDIV